MFVFPHSACASVMESQLPPCHWPRSTDICWMETEVQTLKGWELSALHLRCSDSLSLFLKLNCGCNEALVTAVVKSPSRVASTLAQLPLKSGGAVLAE